MHPKHRLICARIDATTRNGSDMDQVENDEIGGKMNVCRFCGGKLSRWGWFCDPDEPVVYTCCVPCLCDDSIGFAAIHVVPKGDKT